ncbi:hypothetical protein OUZ56_021551 [Daphnia magna]|uniref:THAP-type domain-containing protein n=1 Tax=Daphnia magna TaxID=35525 RepID=A0ABR0ATU1_9CRUS|nr:hypothetical protein OUZ56_021551 [Daphnia magna]
MQLKTTSRVCEEHFVPEDIIKCDETIIDGKVHSIPRQNWKLKIGAYPRIFPSSATSVVPLVQRKPPLERKPLSDITSTYKGFCPSHMKPAKKKERLAAVTKNTVQEIEVGVVESLTVPQLEVTEAALLETNVCFLQSDIDSITLPAKIVNTVTIQKLASVDFTNRSFKQTIINRELTETAENKNSFNSLAQVEELLRNLHNRRICPGIKNDKEKHLNQSNGLIRNGKLVDGVWRADKNGPRTYDANLVAVTSIAPERPLSLMGLIAVFHFVVCGLTETGGGPLGEDGILRPIYQKYYEEVLGLDNPAVSATAIPLQDAIDTDDLTVVSKNAVLQQQIVLDWKV